MQSYINRIVRAAKLDVNLYEEVESDKEATSQAMGVVVLASIAAGIGSMGTTGAIGIVTGTAMALISWYAWAYIAYFVGVKILPEQQTKACPGELLRTIGFASSPGLIRVLAVIPGIAGIVFLVTSIWMLITMIIAVRQALDYRSTLRAVSVCIIGGIIQATIIILLFSVLGVDYSTHV
ncbi:MAG: hypothetical protein U9Q84_02425 [Thermodesulfobacteriota bacterium]|nr:hypothetical protein [Thermodesulfobacteriota bacterium]